MKIFKNSYVLFIIGLLTACTLDQTNKTQDYNIVWKSPSKDYNGSMPLGNGAIGLNVWVEKNGDICFYIGKTDAWDDNGRLLKVGKVRIVTEPALIFSGAEFQQTLDLSAGTILISSSGKKASDDFSVKLKIWVDANQPVITITQESSEPVQMTATIELWRKEPYALPDLNVSDLLEDRRNPGSLHQPVIVEPDVVLRDQQKQIGWYHHNKKSVGFDLTNRLQGLAENFTEDPILHRTFGALIRGSQTERINDFTLRTLPAKSSNLQITVLTKQPSLPADWQEEIEKMSTEIEKIPLLKRYTAHTQWWSAFWDRSWIDARRPDKIEQEADNDAFIVSRAYALQRFINACAGRGRYPIKFNGSIFTVPAPDNPGDADYRRWGPGYWWQNTRLPYISMCTSGDFDMLQPFFRMYAGDIFQTCQFRTKKYFGIDGAYYPECMYFWGSVFTSTYGWEPYENRSDKLQESGWHKWEWVAGPELVFMMLDYYDHTQDPKFIEDKLIPVANAVIQFFDQYYKTNESGKLVMHPSMALETWWECTNPMPEIAGLTGICRRLLNLPENQTTEKDREYWKKFLDKLPDIPLRDTPSGKALAPAEHYANKRNVENPSLYAVFPFRLIGLGNPNLAWGLNALKHRWDQGSFGWRQDELFMTYMGMTNKAKEYLVNRSKTYHEGSRFPAFWGPNYDWIPDQDHGGILLKAFQSMLIQADPYSDKIYLLPAWPKEWDCNFKVHAPYNTVIQGTVKDGQLLDLKLSPKSRAKDVINMFEK